ncbi:hypothetical protein C7974DRAFT_424215 [Boeremia exigua]|uniref:uncharacterized protein n=1 Tax=Boeremia exigua TaxID=749465 RepID=UPI001E8D1B9B|nr:uncharacterized protein C7974DRAFT_424215 [Boeremia exigua]KAH6629117.1 hypothetical protein C7974DRAFT_424215 [Boeremia exigua]
MATKVFANVGKISKDTVLPVQVGEDYIIQLSVIDDRLPDVKVMDNRYQLFDNGRPTCAVTSGGHAWLCKCRIAGHIYNRSSSNWCGYCGEKKSATAKAMAWDLPPGRKLAWILSVLEPHEQTPFAYGSRLPLPLGHSQKAVKPRVGHTSVQKSGVLFLFLRALGFDHAFSYRTSAIAMRWHSKDGSSKAPNVLGLLVASGELVEIKANVKASGEQWAKFDPFHEVELQEAEAYTHSFSTANNS